MNINRMSGTQASRADFQRDVRTSSADAAVELSRSASASDDKLDISSRGSEVGQLVDQLKSMDDVRGTRVEALRGEVAADTYKPDGEQIAEAIISGQ